MTRSPASLPDHGPDVLFRQVLPCAQIESAKSTAAAKFSGAEATWLASQDPHSRQARARVSTPAQGQRTNIRSPNERRYRLSNGAPVAA